MRSSRPASTSRRRPSFRDDLSLVAIRYEKMSQGEAPISVTSVSSFRSSRPQSSASSSTFSYSPGSPIVVVPPIGSIPPPAEEHPALRQSPVFPRTAAVDDWKRDSGHGGVASSSSTPTIDEEDCEHDFPSTKPVSPVVSQTTQEEFCAQVQVQAQHQHQQEKEAPAQLDKHSSDSAATISNQLRPTSPATAASADAHADTDVVTPWPSPTPFLSRRPTTPTSPASATTESRPQSSSPRKSTSINRKKLVKTFSLRSVSTLLGRTDKAQVPIAMPEHDRSQGPGSDSGASGTGMVSDQGQIQQPLVRGSGSPEPTDSAQNGRQPPPQTRKPSGAVSSLWKRGRLSTQSQSQSQSQREIDSDDETRPFTPLSISIPTDGLLDDDFMTGLSFSNRGSVMFRGRRALKLESAAMENQQPDAQPRASLDNGAAQAHSLSTKLTPSATPASGSVSRSVSPVSSPTPDTGYVTPEPMPQTQEPPRPRTAPARRMQPPSHEPPPPPSRQQQGGLVPPPDIRVMAAEVDRESQKVRSLYAVGEGLRWEDGAMPSSGEPVPSPITEVSTEGEEHDPYDFLISPRL